MHTTSTRENNGALGHGFSRAFELALTPVVFGVLGLLLDRWLGTMPLLVIAFSVFGIVGMGLRTWFSYDHEMRELDQKRIAAQSYRERAAAKRSLEDLGDGDDGTEPRFATADSAYGEGFSSSANSNQETA